MANKLTPPPPTGISLLDRWLALLWRLLTADGQINWNQLGGGKTDYVPLNTAATEPTRATGQIYWDSTNKTAAIQMEGADVTLQVGQENHVFARNASGATILNGKVVYVSGAQGNRPRISLAKADSASTAVGTIGLATEDIEDTTDGYVTTQGIVNGLDTSAFVEGDVVYLSAATAGALTTTKPSGNNYIVRVGTVTRVNPSVGAILVNIQLITSEASDVILDHIGVSTYSTLQDLQNIFHSAGWISGGAVTSNGDGTVAVTGGTGVIRATDSALDTIKFFDFSANASVSLTDQTINWVYIDYNAGSPAVTASTTEPANHHTMIKLAEIYRDGTDLHINQTVRYEIGDHAANMVRQMQETMPYAHVSGAMLAESGTRNLNLTSGTFWNGLSRFTTSALNTAVSGSFSTYYRNGAGGWTEVTGQTQVDNTSYDDGDGTLGALTANRYTNRWIYLATDSNVHIVYGWAQHVLLADAQTEAVPSSIPPELQTDSFMIGRIIVRQGVTTLVQIDSAFDMVFNVASVNAHNDLSGLQGGAADEYYHLTSAQHSGLTGGGVTSLHSHSGGSGIGANLIINPFEVNQRALTSVGDDAYCLDRWYVLTESGNVTVAQITDPEAGAPWAIRLTQPDVSAKRIGLAQIIESKDIRHLRSAAANLSMRVKPSFAGNVRYAILEHTGTADSVTSDVVSNWASTTYTPSNFFIAGVNVIKTGTIAPGAATYGDLSDTGTFGASMNNAIIFVWTESAAAQNATLELNRPKLESGSVKTDFIFGKNELSLCQRFFTIYTAGTPFGQFSVAGVVTTVAANAMLITSVKMRESPTLSSSGSFAVFTSSAFPVTMTLASYNGSAAGLNLAGTGLPAGSAATFSANSDASAFISLSAEL